MRRCKENRCRNEVAGGNSIVSIAARALGYCRSCYRMRFPARRRPTGYGRADLNRPLSRDDRIWHEENAFEGMEQLLWSPEFYAEWREYIEARKRGEL